MTIYQKSAGNDVGVMGQPAQPVKKVIWENIIFFLITTFLGVVGTPLYIIHSGISISELLLFALADLLGTLLSLRECEGPPSKPPHHASASIFYSMGRPPQEFSFLSLLELLPAI